MHHHTSIYIFPITFIVFFIFPPNNAFTQILDVKEASKIEFDSPKDYDDFEDQILEYIDWLETQPLGHPDRNKVNSLIFKWAEGTSRVTIAIMPFVLDYVKKNPGFLTLYIGGWIKFALANPEEKSNELKATLAGMNTFLDFYEKGGNFDVQKDKKVLKLLKKRKTGNLEKYISKQY